MANKTEIWPAMLAWGAAMLLGLAILVAYPILRGAVPPEEVGRFGPAVLVPLGYVLAVVGACGAGFTWSAGARSRRSRGLALAGHGL